MTQLLIFRLKEEKYAFTEVIKEAVIYLTHNSRTGIGKNPEKWESWIKENIVKALYLLQEIQWQFILSVTEKAAKEKGYEVKTGRFMFAGNGRAHAIGETDGMVKIVGDAATDEILGIHIMGAEAGEMIATAALAMSMEATVEEIVETIHTHPTLSEVMLEAAEDYYGMGIHSRPSNK